MRIFSPAAPPRPDAPNLLIYRFEAQRERRRKLRRRAGLVALAALLPLLAMGYSADRQRQNDILRAELHSMQAQLALRAPTPGEQADAERLLARRRALPELEQQTPPPAPLLEWVAALEVPELYISAVEMGAEHVYLHGYTAHYPALAALAERVAAFEELTEAEDIRCRWEEPRGHYAFSLRAGAKGAAL